MASLLHVKSEFSLGCGTATVEELAHRAATLRYSTLALTDVENLSAQVRFHAAASAAGLKPITGVELRAGYGSRHPGVHQGRLVLLARNRSGYESLCRVVTDRRTGAGPTPDPAACLPSDPRDVFFLSEDPAVLDRLLRAGVAAADVRFLLTHPDPAVPRHLVPVAAPDVVFLEPGDHPLHVLVAAIRQGRTVSTVTGTEDAARFLPSVESFRRRFASIPEAWDEADRIAAECNLRLLESKPLLPVAPWQAERQEPAAEPREPLRQLALEQLSARGLAAQPSYRDRLEHELQVLDELGLAGYVLLVAEVAGYARSRGIAVAGRGSATGSLVVWLLELGDVDPVAEGLLFERFVHPGRRDLPDIDLDLASDRREEVLDWLTRRFGDRRVAAVCTYQTFGVKTALREGGKALGARAPVEGPLLERLIGRPRHLSVHPGGMVLADSDLTRYAPLERAPKGVRVIQYDLASAARVGLVKLDLLGNRSLAAMEETRRLLDGREPTDPGSTLALLREARTVGCFQLETPAMRSLLRKLPVHGLPDVIATLALVRPGPASGEAKAAFIRRAHGEEPPTPPHPRLHDRLRATHGMLLFEEDLIWAIATLTGWSVAQADQARATLIETDPETPERTALERRFLLAAGANGIPPAEASTSWNWLERFAAYTFSRAHAASYAQLSWRSAALKASFPVEFGCGVLNHYGGQYPLRSVAADLARHGVTMLGPCVNRSADSCTVDQGRLRIGLGNIRFLTVRNRRRILTARPFADWPDFFTRIAPSRREVEALVLSGACDELPPLSAERYPFVHEEVLRAYLEAGTPERLNARPVSDAPLVHTYSRLVRIRNEIRYLGMHPSGHPMAVLREEASRAGCLATTELASRVGARVRIAGLVAASHRIPGLDGQTLQFVTLEDEYGLLESVLRPGTYARLGDPIDNPGPFLVEGTVVSDHSDHYLDVADGHPFYERFRQEVVSRR